MKLHILSDLHVEFAPFERPATDADVVILAGDIHKRAEGIAWARAAFPHQELIYVAGNHEFYGLDWGALLPDLREQAARHRVHLLEDNELVLGEVRFLGATLWTDFDYFGAENRIEAMHACVGYITDFRRISAVDALPAEVQDGPAAKLALGPTLLTPAHVRQRHLQSRAWLEQRLAAPHVGPTVVVTHHLPGAGSVAPRYAMHLGNAGFASHLDEMMGRAALWIHGHTHDSFDYAARGTRVLCNPRGYPMQGTFENPLFDPALVVEL